MWRRILASTEVKRFRWDTEVDNCEFTGVGNYDQYSTALGITSLPRLPVATAVDVRMLNSIYYGIVLFVSRNQRLSTASRAL